MYVCVCVCMYVFRSWALDEKDEVFPSSYISGHTGASVLKVSVCIYVYMHVYMYVCVCMFVCMFCTYACVYQ